MKNTTPLWVNELLDQILIDEGRSKKPKVKWVVSSIHSQSSGKYKPQRRTIRVVAGIEGSDHKQVFLHEIVHWLQHRNPKRVYFYSERRRKRSFHNKRFYLKLKELLVRYDCLTEKYREREHNYMKRSSNYL